MALLILLAIALALAGPARLQAQPAASLRIAASDERGLTIVASLPDLLVEPAPDSAEAASRASLAGWETPAVAGSPLLPRRTVWLALPPGRQALIRAISGEPGRRFEGVRLATAPGQTWINPPLPGEPAAPPRLAAQPAPIKANGSWPAELAHLETPGRVRDQSFVPLTIYGARWDAASRRLQGYRTITIEVGFVAERGASPAIPAPRPDPLWSAALAGLFLNPPPASDLPAPAAPAARPVPETAGARLSLPGPGLYGLALSQLSAAGAPAEWLAEPAFLRLYQGSREIPRAIDGAELVFYLPPYDTRQSDSGGVIVRHTPGVPGLTPGARNLQPAAGAPLAAYTATQRLEQQSLYVSQFPAAEDADHWWWHFWVIYGNGQATPPIEVTFDRDQQALAGRDALITLRLHGGVWGETHQISVTLNGAPLGVVEWAGTGTLREASLAAPAATLLANNTLTLTPRGSLREVGYLEWVEVEYARAYAAVDGRLLFAGPGGAYAVSGLGAGPFDVWDLSDPLAPAILGGYASDGATLRWNDAGPRRYLAQARSQRRPIAAQSIAFWREPDLRAAANAADYLAIAYNPPGSNAWTAALAPLLDRRAAQGLRTAAIDVQWIYDQFGDGRVDPAALRAFLAHAYATWAAPAPSYVLLVGDGTADPHDYEQFLGAPATNYIPPYLAYVDPWLGETAADNRYVTVSGADDIPDLHLGRLPARNAAEVAAMVAKIVSYEQIDPAQPWLDRVLLVADDPDSAGDFPALSDELLPILPPTAVATTLYFDEGGDVAAFRSTLIGAINGGNLFVNYIGHAGIDVWADPVLYNRASVAALTNGDRLAIMLPMTCYTGHFQRNDAQALAEEELRASGGAVAAWAPTGLGLATGHDHLDRAVLDAVLNDGVRRFGPATWLGKLALAAHPGLAPDLLNTYLLFGDPALQIPLAFAPIAAVGDSLTVERNATANFDPRTNDLDPYGHRLRISAVGAPAHGTAEVSRDGTRIIYAPQRYYSGGDSFSYAVYDPANGSRAEATVTVDVIASGELIYIPLLGR